jgi:hypothetical protein
MQGSLCVGNGSNRAAMFALVAKRIFFQYLRLSTAECQPRKVELVDSLGHMAMNCWVNESDGKAHSFSEFKAIRNSRCGDTSFKFPQSKSQRARGYYETNCEILKQIADRFHYERRPREKAARIPFLSDIYGHRKHMSIGLSRREAKFFLDRGKQSPYHSHKFSGAFPARAKFHLHAKGKVVNCCSHFWEGASKPLAVHEGTRFRKAETGRPNQANESIPRLRSLREDRLVGVISIPSAHGRRQY